MQSVTKFRSKNIHGRIEDIFATKQHKAAYDLLAQLRRQYLMMLAKDADEVFAEGLRMRRIAIRHMGNEVYQIP